MGEWRKSTVRWQAERGLMAVLEGDADTTFATLAKSGNWPRCPPPFFRHFLAHLGSVSWVPPLQAPFIVFKMVGPAFSSWGDLRAVIVPPW